MTGLAAQRWAAAGWACLGEWGFGCHGPQQPLAIGVLVCPSCGAGVNPVRAGVCTSHLTLPKYFIFLVFLNLALCWLLEEFQEERQKDVFELRNTAWKSSSWQQFFLYFVIV